MYGTTFTVSILASSEFTIIYSKNTDAIYAIKELKEKE